MAEKKRLTIEVPDEFFRLLKSEAALRNITMRQLVTRAIYHYLKINER